MKDGTRVSLDEALEKLARDVPPPRDLWPGVVRGIVRAPRPAPRLSSAPWIAYAASAAALCLAAALIWVMVEGRSSGPERAANPTALGSPRGSPDSPSAAGVAALAGAGLAEPSDAHYLAARAELERTFDQRLTELDPATRAKIEADLASIRKARDDIRAALSAQPDNPVLEQLLASALHDELDLYDDVVRTTQPNARI
jgi:HAMP domain-containing protein